AGQRVALDELRRGVPAAGVRDARVLPEQVRAVDESLDARQAGERRVVPEEANVPELGAVLRGHLRSRMIPHSHARSNMLALERRKRILARVTTSGGARVVELARILGVHEETIRRDLERLGDEGKVERTHG